MKGGCAWRSLSEVRDALLTLLAASITFAILFVRFACALGFIHLLEAYSGYPWTKRVKKQKPLIRMRKYVKYL